MRNALRRAEHSGSINASSEPRVKKPGTPETWASFLLFAALWAFWSLRYGNYLFAAQENCAFLYRWEFLTRWLDVPDGALCWLSAFVIQFFYYPLLGGAILAGLGVAVQRATAKLLGWRGPAYAASFVPVCLITVSMTWPGYFIFIPFNVPLIFSESIAILLTLGVFALYRRIGTYRARLIFALVFAAAGYRFIACWAAIACVLFAIFEATDASERNLRQRLVRGGTLLAAAVLIPLALQRFWLFPRLKIYNVFSCGLIEDVRYDRDSLTAFFTYRFAQAVPLYLFVVYYWSRFLALRSSESAKAAAKKREERLRRREEKRKEKEALRRLETGKANLTNEKDVDSKKQKNSDRLSDLLLFERAEQKRKTQLLFESLFLLGVVVFFASYHSQSFFLGLEEIRALEDSDWERLLEIDSKIAHPISLTVGMRNLALYKTGRIAEEAFLKPIAGESTLTVDVEDNAKALSGNVFSKFKMQLFRWQTSTEHSCYRSMCELAFAHWGLTNIAARVSTDNLVATEDRSISFDKTLALAAMVNGEKELARRYLRELSQTLFYKKEANACLSYIDSNAFYDGVRDFYNDFDYDAALNKQRGERSGSALEESAAKYGADLSDVKKIEKLVTSIRKERPTENRVSKKAYPNLTFLMEVVRFDDYDQSSLERKELILIAALLQKKGDVFLAHIDDYLKLKGCEKGGAPRAIEQGYATWRYANFSDDWNKCEYKFTPETLEYMDMFIQYTRQYGASGVAVQATLRHTFTGYYWGYAVDDSTFKTY